MCDRYPRCCNKDDTEHIKEVRFRHRPILDQSSEGATARVGSTVKVDVATWLAIGIHFEVESDFQRERKFNVSCVRERKEAYPRDYTRYDVLGKKRKGRKGKEGQR